MYFDSLTHIFFNSIRQSALNSLLLYQKHFAVLWITKEPPIHANYFINNQERIEGLERQVRPRLLPIQGLYGYYFKIFNYILWPLLFDFGPKQRESVLCLIGRTIETPPHICLHTPKFSLSHPVSSCLTFSPVDRGGFWLPFRSFPIISNFAPKHSAKNR